MKNRKNGIVKIFLDYGIVFVLIAMIVVFSLMSKNFLRVNTVLTILKQSSINGIIAVGMTFVIISGGIDISVGASAGALGVLFSYILLSGAPIPVAVILCCLIGICFGFINGFCVNRLSIPPMIATLGLQTTIRGIGYIVTGGMPVYGFDARVSQWANQSLFFIPNPVVLMLIVFFTGAIILTKTKFGRHLYAVGGNAEAARLSGVNIFRTRYLAYITCGLCAAISAMLLVARTNSGQPSAGVGFEMDAITSSVLGGISISGGEGNIWLVIVGVIIMGVLKTGMIMIHLNEYVQQVIQGIVLVGACAFSQFAVKMKAKQINVD